MLEAAESACLAAHPVAKESPTHRRRSGTIYFVLEGLNSLAAAYYFNYLFFYMRDHFGFGNRENLLLTVLHGFCYMFAAWNAGRFAQRFGYLFSLRLGFSGMGLALLLAALIPKVWGFSSAAMFAEFGALLLWTFSMCLTWPTLQTLLSRHEPPAALPRTAGIYNVVWAGGASISYLTGGALLEKFGGEILFWVPVALHGLELLLMTQLPPEPKTAAAEATVPEQAGTDLAETVAPISKSAPPLTPRPISRARTFLYLAWLANPFAYVAINGILPVIPKLADHLGLSHANAGLICSVWLWVRLAAFILFWLWTGWHYRFRWLLGSFIALGVSFSGILLSPNIFILVAAQIVFGLAVGLIYYSSLFYSMDVGASKGKHGGVHEAAIGMGVFSGPAVGATALYFLPAVPNAGILAISAFLVLGLIPFLLIKRWGDGRTRTPATSIPH